MDKKNTSISELLKKMKPQDFIYPSVVLFFFIMTIVIFLLATKFISKNINKIFAPGETAAIQSLDLDQYKLIAKKLNIDVSSPQDVPPQNTTSSVDIGAVSLDKSTIAIIIKNSTLEKGVASALAQQFKNEGYKKIATGNEPRTYSTTTILIKESYISYGPILLDAVRKFYPSVIATTTTETGSADAIIIIGNQ
ncbi:MAG: LytR C-terminal domain-containing protein [Patescibacteria group bacterium]